MGELLDDFRRLARGQNECTGRKGLKEWVVWITLGFVVGPVSLWMCQEIKHSWCMRQQSLAQQGAVVELK
jgi:hypothetical protein